MSLFLFKTLLAILLMAIHSFTSKHYKGIMVLYRYAYEPRIEYYTSHGDFNGGMPQTLDIEIEDILIEQISILDWVSLSVFEGLEEEIAAQITSIY